MSLPFLNAKKIASIVIAKTRPEGGIEPMHEEGEAMPEMLSAAEDLLSAIEMKDAHRVAQALQAAFEIADSMPQESMDADGE